MNIFTLLSVIVFSYTVDARKSYLVKDRVNSGNITVYSPRVGASTPTWCLFKDGSGNQFCFSTTMVVKWEMKPTTVY